jgi:tetratricopeptide (TPR) repeat protein/TolB-like protein
MARPAPAARPGVTPRQGFSPSERTAVVLVLVVALVAPARAQCPDGSPPPCGPAVPRMPRVQVLPFATLAGDTASAYLAQALTDDLRDALASTRAVVLLTGASARAAADVAVRGTVVQRGASVRVDARVERPATGRVLWSGSASRVPRDLPAVAAHVATQTLQAAGVRAGPVVTAAPADPHLFDLLRRARYQRLRRTEAGLNRSIALQREAIAYDSTSPEAWAGLARSLSLALRRSVPVADVDPDRVLPLALQAAERAVELDPVSPTAWLARGQVAVDVQPGSRSVAIAAFRRALALDSAYTDAWGSLGIALEEAGDTAGAREAFARTLALRPDDSEHLTWMALHHMWQREYQVAARWADSAVAMDPTLPVARGAAAQTTLRAGRPADALEHFGALMRLTGNSADFGNGVNVEALAAQGDTASARNAQETTVARAGPTPSQHGTIAIAIGRVALGDTARALAALTAYPSPGDLHYQLHLRLEPGLDRLRRHATFQQLLAPVGGARP